MKNQNDNRSMYSKSGTPEARKAVEDALKCVFEALPNAVATDLSQHWHKLFGAGPLSGFPLPITTNPAFFKMLRAECGVSLPLFWVDRGLFCDIEFFETAPVEAADSVVALAFADAYMGAKGLAKDTLEEQFLACKKLIEAWGYFPDELELWYAALQVNPRAAVVNYYAFRFARYGLEPSAASDLSAIAALLKQRGCYEHAQAVADLAARLN